jgi:hypothetical protein
MKTSKNSENFEKMAYKMHAKNHDKNMQKIMIKTCKNRQNFEKVMMVYLV